MKSNKLIIDEAKLILKKNLWKYIGLGFIYISIINTVGTLALNRFIIAIATLFRETESSFITSIILAGVYYSFFIILAVVFLSYFLNRVKLDNSGKISPKNITDCIKSVFQTHIIQAVFTGLLSVIHITGHTLLFIIPGIMKALSYSMSIFVMIDNPHLTEKAILNQSSKLMQGHRMQLFLLQLGFCIRIITILAGASAIGIFMFLTVGNSDFLVENFDASLNSSVIAMGLLAFAAMFLVLLIISWLTLSVSIFYKELTTVPSSTTSTIERLQKIA